MQSPLPSRFPDTGQCYVAWASSRQGADGQSLGGRRGGAHLDAGGEMDSGGTWGVRALVAEPVRAIQVRLCVREEGPLHAALKVAKGEGSQEDGLSGAPFGPGPGNHAPPGGGRARRRALRTHPPTRLPRYPTSPSPLTAPLTREGWAR